MSYSTFSLTKDSLMSTDDIKFLYDKFRIKFPMMHYAMFQIVSSSSYHVDLADRFCGFFMHNEDKEPSEGSDDDTSSDDTDYNSTLVVTKGSHNQEHTILEHFISFIWLKS